MAIKIVDFDALEELIEQGRRYQAAQDRLSMSERQRNPYEREAALKTLAELEEDHERLLAVFAELEEGIRRAESSGERGELAALLLQKGTLLARVEQRQEAIEVLDEALACVGPTNRELELEITLRRASTLGDMGRQHEAETILDEQLAKVDPGRAADRALLLGHKGDLYLAGGQDLRAQRAFEQALETEGLGAGSSDSTRLKLGLARALKAQGELERAAEVLLEGLNSGQAAEDGRRQWQLLRELLELDLGLGRMEEYLAHCHQARNLAEERGDHVEAAIQRENAVTALLSLGRYERALILLHESLEYVRRRGPRMKKLVLMMQLGKVYYELGRLEESETVYKDVLEEAQDQNNARSMTVALGRLGALYAEQGKLEAGRHYGELAVEKVESGQEPEIAAEQHVLLALTYRDLGERELARESCRKAIQLYGQVEQSEMAARARELLTELES